ncbi:MAG: UDP-N-acetylmuramoyl-L-alanine--D-glutamate ligase [Spirochaetota bacterium]
MSERKKKKVLIMGLGLHGGGLGAANYFLKKNQEVIITDLRTAQELKHSLDRLVNTSNVELVLGRHRYRDFERADLVIKNPAVRGDSPYLKYAYSKGIRVDTDVGIFVDNVRKITPNIIGVTGTKGKSTTTALIHSIIKTTCSDALVAGNIRVPVLDLLDMVKPGSYVVLELSSFQLGGIAAKCYSPRLGVFINFMQDHLNYYADMEDYFRDKEIIYRYQDKNGIMVLNREDQVYCRAKPHLKGKAISFGVDRNFTGEGTYIHGQQIWYRNKKKKTPVMDARSLKLPGKHNLYNVLAAAAVGCVEGIPEGKIKEAVGSFQGLEHRLEFVGMKKGVGIFNDSAATTPRAAVHAINSFQDPINLIAGGTDKGLETSLLARTINCRVKNVFLLKGTGTSRLLKSNILKNYKVYDNLKDAVYDAYNSSTPGDILLFSPGFASFEMFLNEFDRGEQFKIIADQILKKGDAP